jgi:hypothetical protein
VTRPLIGERQPAGERPPPARLRLDRFGPLASVDWVAVAWIIALFLAPLLLAGIIDRALPVFRPVLLAVIVTMPVVFAAFYPRPAVVVAVLIVWFAFHKVIVALFAPIMSDTSVAWTYNAKEALYMALGLACVVIAPRVTEPGRGLLAGMAALLRRLRLADWMAVALIGLVAVYFVISIAVGLELQGVLVYARRFASLPILFLIGRLLLSSPGQLERAMRVFVWVSVIVATVGLLERLVFGDAFWRNTVGIDRIFHILSDEGFTSDNARLREGMPANWFSYIGQVPVRRLVSTFFEPTGLAMSLALALGIAAFGLPSLRARRLLWLGGLVIIGAALLLTIGKAGYLVALIIGVVTLLRATRRSAPIVLVAIGLVVVGLLVLSPVLPLGENVARHIRGLTSGMLHLLEAPLGAGLGSTGFWGERPSVGSDSTVGVLVSQIGFVGGGLWLGWLLSTAWLLLPDSSATPDPAATTLRRTLAAAIVALAIVSVLSNSASGLLAGAFFALFSGWAIASFVVPLAHPPPARNRPDPESMPPG